MKYHLNIIDGNVELPKKIDIEYTDLNTAYNALSSFVHSYDYDAEEEVCGRVIDEDGNDVDYCNSIFECRFSVNMDGECAEGFDTLKEAINHANYLYGKGYSDDVTIWDNKEEKEIEY